MDKKRKFDYSKLHKKIKKKNVYESVKFLWPEIP